MTAMDALVRVPDAPQDAIESLPMPALVQDLRVRRFGRCVRAARIQRRMTQAELARLVKCSQPHIVFVEQGRIAPRLDLAADLARHLDLSLDRLFRVGKSA